MELEAVLSILKGFVIYKSKIIIQILRNYFFYFNFAKQLFDLVSGTTGNDQKSDSGITVRLEVKCKVGRAMLLTL